MLTVALGAMGRLGGAGVDGSLLRTAQQCDGVAFDRVRAGPLRQRVIDPLVILP